MCNVCDLEIIAYSNVLLKVTLDKKTKTVLWMCVVEVGNYENQEKARDTYWYQILGNEQKRKNNIIVLPFVL